MKMASFIFKKSTRFALCFHPANLNKDGHYLHSTLFTVERTSDLGGDILRGNKQCEKSTDQCAYACE